MAAKVNTNSPSSPGCNKPRGYTELATSDEVEAGEGQDMEFYQNLPARSSAIVPHQVVGGVEYALAEIKGQDGEVKKDGNPTKPSGDITVFLFCLISQSQLLFVDYVMSV